MVVVFISILLLLGFTGCTTTSGEIQDWPWQDPEVEQPETPEDIVEDATLAHEAVFDGDASADTSHEF